MDSSENQVEVPLLRGWSQTDLLELLSHISRNIKLPDVEPFEASQSEIDWEAVSFGSHSSADCKGMWEYIVSLIRQHRILTEMVHDAIQWVPIVGEVTRELEKLSTSPITIPSTGQAYDDILKPGSELGERADRQMDQSDYNIKMSSSGDHSFDPDQPGTSRQTTTTTSTTTAEAFQSDYTTDMKDSLEKNLPEKNVLESSDCLLSYGNVPDPWEENMCESPTSMQFFDDEQSLPHFLSSSSGSGTERENIPKPTGSPGDLTWPSEVTSVGSTCSLNSAFSDSSMKDSTAIDTGAEEVNLCDSSAHCLDVNKGPTTTDAAEGLVPIISPAELSNSDCDCDIF